MVACGKCRQPLQMSVSALNVGIPALQSRWQAVVQATCETCGFTLQPLLTHSGTLDFDHSIHFMPENVEASSIPADSSTPSYRTMIVGRGADGPHLQFRVARVQDDDVWVSVREGSIQDGTCIGPDGNADLMADMAEEYLDQFWTLTSKWQLPTRLVQVMPSLVLLFTAAELGIKAFYVRTGRAQDARGTSHGLMELYANLSADDRQDIERRFRAHEDVAPLKAMGIELPKIEDVLFRYVMSYDSGGVYMDARYFAEPTTLLPSSSNLHGSNLIKSHTPYPVFLPTIVRVTIDAYRAAPTT